MSSLSNKPFPQLPANPVAAFDYRDICTHEPAIEDPLPQDPVVENEATLPPPPVGPSPQEIEAMVNRARAEGAAETEKRLSVEFEAKAAAEAAKVRKALEDFQAERKEYFSRVEGEVVKLSLSIAAKILHRESQVDPTMVAALVRYATDKLHDGATVSVRVSPATAGKWREQVTNPLNSPNIRLTEDAQLGPGDCILETDMGSTNFNIDVQLKEVERGFFDLLAQRPH